MSKEFYLKCKDEGIASLDSKSNIARMFLIAENEGLIATEAELVEEFNAGKAAFEKSKMDEKQKKEIDLINKIRGEERLQIEQAKAFVNCTGRDKPISICEKGIEVLQAKLKEKERKRQDAFNANIAMSVAMYKAREIKEKDWAIHGGIASGIAGPAAGVATALEIQQQNAQAREHNQQLMQSISQMQAGNLDAIYSSYNTENLEEKIEELKQEINGIKKRLVEKLSAVDLLLGIKPKVLKQAQTKTGALKLSVQIQPISNLKIYDNVKAVVDGTFKALILDKDRIIGEVYFALPYKGVTKQEILTGFCADCKVSNNGFDIVFVPVSLWAIETKEKINLTKNVEDIVLEKDNVIFYIVKDAIYNNCSDIGKCNNAIEVLKEMSDSDNAKKLMADCEEKIKSIRAYEEKVRIRKEQQEAHERESLETKARLEKEEKQKRRRKLFKMSTIAVSVILTLAILVVVFINYVIPNIKYNKAASLLERSNEREAISLLSEISEYKDSRELIFENSNSKIIGTNHAHTLGVKKDGTVAVKPCSYSYCEGQCNVKDWTDIAEISLGSNCTVGLKNDGTVVATEYEGSAMWYYGEGEVSNWRDITSIATGGRHTVGLKSNGTVVVTEHIGSDASYFGQGETDGWASIVAIAAGDIHTVGLKSDGTVVAVGDNRDGQCNVSSWTDIVAITANDRHTVGLKKDGTVVACGKNDYGQCDVLSWRDIIAINAGEFVTAGLKSDGTVVCTAFYNDDVSDWSNIVAISASGKHMVGVRANGTGVSTTYQDNMLDIEKWNLFK